MAIGVDLATGAPVLVPLPAPGFVAVPLLLDGLYTVAENTQVAYATEITMQAAAELVIDGELVKVT
jgi:hypothetical protein